MRKVLLLAGVVAALLVGVWLLMDTGDAAPGPEALAEAEIAKASPQRSVAPEKLNAVLLQPVKSQTGAGTIRGKVTNGGEPVAGATVTATRADSEESLSELPCQCDNVCGQKLLACGCGEASEQLMALVTERNGEVVPVGRTVTANDGTFELTQLDPGEVALWADSPRLGTSLQLHVAVGSDNVALQLGDGIAIKGKVTIDGSPAPANAWVTAIHGEQSRFFDVLTEGDGTFAIGPLPVGLYSLVAGAPGALPGHLHLRKDSPVEGFEITLYTPRLVTGTVELDGKPAGGVPVKLSGNHRESETVTAGDGTFRFTELRPGRYQVSASNGSLRADGEGRVPKMGNAEPLRLVLVQGARLSGIVRNEAGPVAGADVTLRDLGRQTKAKTDANGRYALEAPPASRANVWATTDGFVKETAHVDLVAGQEAHLDFTLRPIAHVFGIVVDADGQPVSNAMVSIKVDDETNLGAMTIDNGTFELITVAAGSYQVTVTHQENASATTTVVAPSKDVRIQLPPGLAVNGTVVDESGKPLVGAELKMWLPERDDVIPRPHLAKSDAEGRFRMRGLVAGTHTLRAETKDGAASEEVVVSSTQGPSVRLVIAAFSSISGTVVDSAGNTVPQANVMAVGADIEGGHAKSDANGAFTLSKLKKGVEYQVMVLDENMMESTQAQVMAGRTDVKLVMPSSLEVRGRVADTEGKPIPGVRVNQRPADASGSFTLRVSGQTKVQLLVNAKGYASVTKEVPLDGKDVDVGTITLGGRTLQVRVVDAETNQPLSRASVWLASDWRDDGMSPMTVTDGAGLATVRGLPAVNAVIVVNHNTHSPLTVPVEDGANEKTVRLESGATLDIKVTDAAGKPVRTEVTGVETGTGHSITLPTDKAGAVKFEGMGVGEWTLIAVQASRNKVTERAQQVVQIPKSGVVPVSLVLKAGAASVTINLPGSLASAPVVVLVYPPAVQPPTTVRQLMGVAELAVETKNKGGHYVIDGVMPGTYLGVVIRPGGAKFRWFNALFEVTSAPQQTVTLQEGTWLEGKME